MDKPCDTVLQQVSIEEILEEQRLQQQAKQKTEKAKVTALKDRGLSIPKADNLDEYWRHFCSIFLRNTGLLSYMLNRGLFWRLWEECVLCRWRNVTLNTVLISFWLWLIGLKANNELSDAWFEGRPHNLDCLQDYIWLEMNYDFHTIALRTKSIVYSDELCSCKQTHCNGKICFP